MQKVVSFGIFKLDWCHAYVVEIVLSQAIVAALFMNVYIVGLNQLSDIEIDKVSS